MQQPLYYGKTGSVNPERRFHHLSSMMSWYCVWCNYVTVFQTKSQTSPWTKGLNSKHGQMKPRNVGAKQKLLPMAKATNVCQRHWNNVNFFWKLAWLHQVWGSFWLLSLLEFSPERLYLRRSIYLLWNGTTWIMPIGVLIYREINLWIHI